MNVKRKSATRAKRSGDIIIPDKLYFRIGEVARLFHLPAYVLRFWETEFPQLKPIKSSTGQRMYRRRDLDNILKIKRLLYEEGFTIAGARQHLRDEHAEKKQSPLPFPSQGPVNLAHFRHELKEILGILSARH
jgi:DNA-binding transcriptional MerR regulator